MKRRGLLASCLTLAFLWTINSLMRIMLCGVKLFIRLQSSLTREPSTKIPLTKSSSPTHQVIGYFCVRAGTPQDSASYVCITMTCITRARSISLDVLTDGSEYWTLKQVSPWTPQRIYNFAGMKSCAKQEASHSQTAKALQGLVLNTRYN